MMGVHVISLDWFLYDRNLCHERVNELSNVNVDKKSNKMLNLIIPEIKTYFEYILNNIRSSCPEVFCKKGVLRTFTNSLCQSLFFNKVAGLRPKNTFP